MTISVPGRLWGWGIVFNVCRGITLALSENISAHEQKFSAGVDMACFSPLRSRATEWGGSGFDLWDRIGHSMLILAGC